VQLRPVATSEPVSWRFDSDSDTDTDTDTDTDRRQCHATVVTHPGAFLNVDSRSPCLVKEKVFSLALQAEKER
jgi:hypothetical protein